MERCKTAARKMKADHSRTQSIVLNLRDYVPPRQRCDVLVHAYFRTFETIFRVLHQPTFNREYEQYWQDPSLASETFVVTMLLVLSIGTCFHRSSDDQKAFYDYLACRWVHAAQLWISTPFEKHHLNLKGLQIHCLLLLSVQVNANGADLTWISAGTLLRAAMMIGLHREPSLFPQIPALEAEIRRRLWATVLELTVQSALDSGMPPMISVHDYDCGMPSNIDDDQIDESLEGLPPAKPMDVYTHTSGQLALAGHLPLRLQIVEGLNRLHSPISFLDALEMYKSLSGSCRSVSAKFQTFLAGDSTSDSPTASAFQVKLLDQLSRRFLLSLHVPFVLQARSDLTYYYSRKVCLESSFFALSYQNQGDGSDDYKSLQTFSRGFFKSIFLQAGFMLFVELTARLSDDDFECSMVLDYNALYHVLGQLVETCRRRLEVGETNVKSYVIFSCALAQVEALRVRKDPASAVLHTARKTLQESLSLLRADSSTTTNAESVPQSELPNETLQDLMGAIFVSKINYNGPIVTLSNSEIRKATWREPMIGETTGLKGLSCDGTVGCYEPADEGAAG